MKLPAADWPTFAAAAALLLVPLPLFFGKRVEYRELDRDWSRFIRPLVALPWHWLDLARFVAGTWLLARSTGLSWVIRDADLPPNTAAQLLVGAVVALAVLTQTVACKAPDVFHAAILPVVGMTVVLLPPLVSGLALVSAITLALALRSPAAFFGGMAIAVVGFGYGFYRQLGLLAGVSAASGLPLLLPLLFHRELVLAHGMRPAERLPACR